MLSYCLQCRKNAESKNPKVVNPKTQVSASWKIAEFLIMLL